MAVFTLGPVFTNLNPGVGTYTRGKWSSMCWNGHCWCCFLCVAEKSVQIVTDLKKKVHSS